MVLLLRTSVLRRVSALGLRDSDFGNGGRVGLDINSVRFLIDEAFTTPTWLVVPEISQRVEVEGSLRRINNAQSPVLSTLLNNRRMERMIEYEAVATDRSTV